MCSWLPWRSARGDFVSGLLVYALPLYHPIRLIEEICMLDQISGGRLEIGFGRGASSTETAFMGSIRRRPSKSTPRDWSWSYKASPKECSIFAAIFSFENVPMELEPLQKPYPPIWYGVHSVDSAERAARKGLHVVSLDPPLETRSFVDRYRQVWRETRGAKSALPKSGSDDSLCSPIRMKRPSALRAAPTQNGTGAFIICMFCGAVRRFTSGP